MLYGIKNLLTYQTSDTWYLKNLKNLFFLLFLFFEIKKVNKNINLFNLNMSLLMSL